MYLGTSTNYFGSFNVTKLMRSFLAGSMEIRYLKVGSGVRASADRWVDLSCSTLCFKLPN